jgi:ubiquinone/menaquinone biosynthesis C-methylase UbiE
MIEALRSKLADLHRIPGMKILDIGGWHAPCRQATHIVDIMPFESMNVGAAYGEGTLQIRPENYHRLDLCGPSPLPFADKEFAFVICRHTLEDLRDPITVCREMLRVAQAGYIECPSRLCESTKGMQRPQWCGFYHHRWLVEVAGDTITFQFKPHNLHFSRDFYFRRWPWQRMRERYANTFLLWESGFRFDERVIIDYREVQENLRAFKRTHRAERPFRLRWQRDG